MDDFASFASGEDLKKQAEQIAQYSGKNEGELLRDIYKRAEQAKRAGTLTNAQIDEFYRQFAPALDAAKRKKLQKLIAQLKEL